MLEQYYIKVLEELVEKSEVMERKEVSEHGEDIVAKIISYFDIVGDELTANAAVLKS